MSELDKDWVPEIGQECEYRWKTSHWWIKVRLLCETDRNYFIQAESNDYSVNKHLSTFRPIKTEAENRRAAHIEEIGNALSNAGFYGAHKSENEYRLHRIYNAGCRMTHKITDVEIAKLYRKHLVTDVSGTGYDFARAIENIILGEN